jgi:hypothetical protein
VWRAAAAQAQRPLAVAGERGAKLSSRTGRQGAPGGSRTSGRGARRLEQTLSLSISSSHTNKHAFLSGGPPL